MILLFRPMLLGDYHLMVLCTDEAGNQTEVARNIVLSADGGTETEHDHE